MIGFPHCGLWNSRCWHPGRTSFSLSHCSRCVVVPLPDAVLDCLAAQPSVTWGELVFDTCLISTDFQISGALVFLFKSTVVGWWRWTWDAEAWKPALELDVYRLAMPCNSCNQVGGFLRDFIGCSTMPQGFCQNQLGNLNWCSNYSVLSEAQVSENLRSRSVAICYDCYLDFWSWILWWKWTSDGFRHSHDLLSSVDFDVVLAGETVC